VRRGTESTAPLSRIILTWHIITIYISIYRLPMTPTPTSLILRRNDICLLSILIYSLMAVYEPGVLSALLFFLFSALSVPTHHSCGDINLVLGIANGFGIFQTYLLQHQLAGHTQDEVAWIGSIQIFTSFFGGLFSGRYIAHLYSSDGVGCVIRMDHDGYFSEDHFVIY
jgi:hypothetical protein